MTVIRVAVLVAVAVVLAGCGSAVTPGAGGDSGVTGAAVAPPAAVPRAEGPVTGVGTVIEVPGGSPELCLGPVRESYPPQCEGLPLGHWDWATAGMQEEVPSGTGSTTRWGMYTVTGTFDGLVLDVTGSEPWSSADATEQPSPRPMAPPELTGEQWASVEAGVRVLPGLLTSMREGDRGPVLVDVVHDDGTLQDWVDVAFPAGAVRVTSMLR